MGIKKKTSAKTAASLPVGIGLGVLVSFIVTLIGAGAVTHLVATEAMEENSIGIHDNPFPCMPSVFHSKGCESAFDSKIHPWNRIWSFSKCDSDNSLTGAS